MNSYGDVDTNDAFDIVDFGVDPSSGSVNLNSDGNYEFTPNKNFNGLATFTYTVTDGSAQLQQEQFIRITQLMMLRKDLIQH